MFTGKTSVELSAGRSLGSSQTLFSSYVVDDGISLTPVYAATEKISIRPSLSYARRTFEGSPFAGSDELRQSTRAASVAADWAIRRNIGISLSLATSNRTSNNSAFQYRDRSAVLGGQLKF